MSDRLSICDCGHHLVNHSTGSCDATLIDPDNGHEEVECWCDEWLEADND